MSGAATMSPIWAARDTARSLMQHYGVDPEAHLAEQLEFADEVGEELLSLARRFLEEKGLLAADLETEPTAPVLGQGGNQA